MTLIYMHTCGFKERRTPTKACFGKRELFDIERERAGELHVAFLILNPLARRQKKSVSFLLSPCFFFA
jgi:hypothetical protein